MPMPAEALLKELESDSDLLRLQTPESGKSWIHHNPDKKRVEVQYFFHPIEKRLIGLATWGPEAEGPPGCGHGGSIATVLDDAMGTTAWASGHRVVALNLNVNFRKFVVLGSTARVECVVERIEGRKVFTKGKLTSAEGDLIAESEGLFLQIDFSKLLDKMPKGAVA
jgi:acyl-coenzyme A thioesterase PaaI-like protein